MRMDLHAFIAKRAGASLRKIRQRLEQTQASLANARSPAYLDQLVGTLGLDPALLGPKM